MELRGYRPDGLARVRSSRSVAMSGESLEDFADAHDQIRGGAARSCAQAVPVYRRWNWHRGNARHRLRQWAAEKTAAARRLPAEHSASRSTSAKSQSWAHPVHQCLGMCRGSGLRTRRPTTAGARSSRSRLLPDSISFEGVCSGSRHDYVFLDAAPTHTDCTD
jgi:hypothetical protein